MRSLRYLTQGVPSAFADCVDYRQTHPLKEVRLDLKTENEIGQSIIILRLEGEFTWIFEDRTVVYSEIMGGIVEGEDEVRQERSLHNANRRLFRRIKDFEDLGIDVTNSDIQFHYGELVTGRGEPEASRIEKISKAMREFYRTFPRYRFGKRKLVIILLGLAVFFVVFSMPEWHPAVDPAGQSIPLTREGKGAIALFLLALVWWVFEAAPLGVTTVAIGIFQALFSIRPAGEAFRDFMDPSVLFIFGSVILGLALTKTGLARRLAYWMLRLVGERTSMILLGGFILTAALSHIMAHTAAAATVFPLLVIINEFYSGKDEKPTRFGKALFIGMAYAAGAGSIVTFLGSARGAAAASLYSDFTGREITFFELSKYMFPVGWLMVLIIWVVMIIFFRPEKRTISGLRLKVQGLSREMGPLAKYEKIVIAVLAGVIALMILNSTVPILKALDRTSVMLIAVLLLFLLNVLNTKDLTDVPWNIILLFCGAMSIGFCLWKTGAARWVAVKWLVLFKDSPWIVFVLSVAVLVLILTNFIMNVAAISVTLPVSLTIAGYLGVPPELILYSSLVMAGMPFLLIIGAPPNAIAYGSRQFSPGWFFAVGLPTSVILILVLIVALLGIWPVLGMPVLLP